MIHHVELLTRNNNYHGTEPNVAGSYQGSYGDDANDSAVKVMMMVTTVMMMMVVRVEAVPGLLVLNSSFSHYSLNSESVM